MEASIIFGVLTIVNILFTTWLAFRRTKSQNILDDSTASVNYRKMVVDMQVELKETKEEMNQLKEIVENSELEFGISLQINKQPIVTHWKWKAVETKT